MVLILVQNKYRKEKSMKKSAVITVAAVMAAVFTACNSGMGENGGTPSNGKTNKVDHSQRTFIDAAKYTDFTMGSVDAKKFTKQDIMYALDETYTMNGGNSYIAFNRKDGTITLSSDDAWYNDEGRHNIYARYSFDVQAANEYCLYIKMDNKKGAQLIIDDESFSDHMVPDLLVCVPLYGFSRNRIEVSPVMDGYILMPSGTYWTRKK
jgi:hypothetical protein